MTHPSAAAHRRRNPYRRPPPPRRGNRVLRPRRELSRGARRPLRRPQPQSTSSPADRRAAPPSWPKPSPRRPRGPASASSTRGPGACNAAIGVPHRHAGLDADGAVRRSGLPRRHRSARGSRKSTTAACSSRWPNWPSRSTTRGASPNSSTALPRRRFGAPGAGGRRPPRMTFCASARKPPTDSVTKPCAPTPRRKR